MDSMEARYKEICEQTIAEYRAALELIAEDRAVYANELQNIARKALFMETL